MLALSGKKKFLIAFIIILIGLFGPLVDLDPATIKWTITTGFVYLVTEGAVDISRSGKAPKE